GGVSVRALPYGPIGLKAIPQVVRRGVAVQEVGCHVGESVSYAAGRVLDVVIAPHIDRIPNDLATWRHDDFGATCFVNVLHIMLVTYSLLVEGIRRLYFPILA